MPTLGQVLTAAAPLVIRRTFPNARVTVVEPAATHAYRIVVWIGPPDRLQRFERDVPVLGVGMSVPDMLNTINAVLNALITEITAAS